MASMMFLCDLRHVRDVFESYTLLKWLFLHFEAMWEPLCRLTSGEFNLFAPPPWFLGIRKIFCTLLYTKVQRMYLPPPHGKKYFPKIVFKWVQTWFWHVLIMSRTSGSVRRRYFIDRIRFGLDQRIFLLFFGTDFGKASGFDLNHVLSPKYRRRTLPDIRDMIVTC